jgi:glycosyltransferase involved in cell wall biosynthesis
VEIMHFGKQVYAFDCVFNRLTTEGQAVYFSSAEELRSFITEPDLLVNNENMREIALRRYTWSVVAKQYESLYDN